MKFFPELRLQEILVHLPSLFQVMFEPVRLLQRHVEQVVLVFFHGLVGKRAEDVTSRKRAVLLPRAQINCIANDVPFDGKQEGGAGTFQPLEQPSFGKTNQPVSPATQVFDDLFLFVG